MKIISHFFLAISAVFITNFCSAQILGVSECLSDNDAVIGLDRKAWTSQIEDLSESYQFDFEIPEEPPFDCYEVDYVDITIDLDVQDNTILPECILGYWTHVLDCDDHDPISCPDILYDRMGLNTAIRLVNDLENGMTLGVDVVVLTVSQNDDCNQMPISLGEFVADLEICVEIYYVPKEIDEEIDLGDDIIICAGDVIDIDGPGGFEEYQWDGPVTSDEQTLEDAVAGDYTLEVFDEEGCRLSDDISIIEEGDFLIEFNEESPILLCENASGTISAAINSIENNPDFDYQWTFNGQDISDLAQIEATQQGIYTLEVTNPQTDCSQIESIEVNQISLSVAQIDSMSVDTLFICENDSMEVSAFVPFDDNNTYIYEWYFENDTINGSQIQLTEEGTYVLNQSNSLGCPSSTDTIVVINSIFESAGEDTQSSLCQGNTFDLNSLLSNDISLNGIWSESSNLITITNGEIASNTPPGNYQFLYVIDNMLPCPNDTSIHAVNIIQESINAGDDNIQQICFNEGVDLSTLINGDLTGIFYNQIDIPLSNTNFDNTNLFIGSNIFYYVVESANCANDTANLEIVLLEELPETLVDDQLCDGQTIDINGITYDSMNSTDTQLLVSGNGCDSIVNIDLQIINAVSSDLPLELCEGESIEINGTLFDESNDSGPVLFPNGSVSGCDSIVNVSVTFLQALTETITPSICQDGSIEINGETFDQNNDNGTQDLVSVSGCDSILTIQLDIIPSTDETLSLEICDGDVITINGTDYDASSTSDTQTLTNAAGCDSLLNINISVLQTSELVINESLCEGESITINNTEYMSSTQDIIILENQNASGCDSIINLQLEFLSNSEFTQEFIICDGDSVFIVDEWISTAGEFTDIIPSANSCDSTIISNVILEDCTVSLNILNTIDVLCDGGDNGSIELNLSTNTQGYSLSIINNTNLVFETTIDSDFNFIIDNLSAGNYQLVLRDENGNIEIEESVEISDPDPVSVSVDFENVLCSGESTASITLDIIGGTNPYDISWSSGQTGSLIENLAAGIYAYTITDNNNCTFTGEQLIEEPIEQFFELNLIDPSCSEVQNGIVEVTAAGGGNPPYQYSINGSAFQNTTVFDNLSEGQYIIVMSDSESCTQELAVSLLASNDLMVDQVPPITIDLGETYQLSLNANFEVDSIAWSNPAILSCSNCLDPIISTQNSTTLSAELYDANGCFTTIEILITVEEPRFNDIYLPNIISVNSVTGTNDTFVPLISQQSTIEFISMQIYDRWGNLIFEEQGELQGWDGYINDRKAIPGVYVYQIEYTLNGENLVLQGQLSLVN